MSGGDTQGIEDRGLHELTRRLTEWAEGRDDSAFEQLWPLVEHDLAVLARAALRRERSDHTLQPTALVNEALLSLLGRRTLSWPNRSSFFGTASDLMRKVLASHARRRNALKRGGGAERLSFEDVFEKDPGEEGHRRAEALPGWWIDKDPDELLEFEEALQRLHRASPRRGRIVELRVFFGLTDLEIAEALAISRRTVQRERCAALGMLAELLDPPDPDPSRDPTE